MPPHGGLLPGPRKSFEVPDDVAVARVLRHLGASDARRVGRRVNLTRPPFSPPAPVRLLPDPDTAQLEHVRATGRVPHGPADAIAAWEARFHDKSLGLWHLDDLRDHAA